MKLTFELRSTASVSHDIGKGILTEIIEGLEPKVHRVRDENKYPLGIRWDFYAVVGRLAYRCTEEQIIVMAFHHRNCVADNSNSTGGV